MGPMNLYFDVRDIFRAPRLALSGKKIWTMMQATFVGYFIYGLFSYFAMMAQGVTFGDTWEIFGIFPPPVALQALAIGIESTGWGATLLSVIGILGGLICLMLGATAVARITYKQLKGDEFYSSRDACKFVKKHWHAPVFTHLSIIIIAAFFVIMAIIFALIGKIPYLGELFFGIPYLLWFAGSVFVVYTMVVLMISTFFTHAIVGAMEEDTMGAVFQIYSITWSQIWRVLLYLPLIYSLVAIGTVVFYFFMTEGYNLVNCIFGKDWLMGDKLARMIGWVVGDTFMAGPASLLAWEAPDFFLYEPEGTMEYIGGAFIAISLFVIFWAILSYALCVKVAGQTIALVIFKKRSDDDNLLERKDEEELEAEEEAEEWSAEVNNDDDEKGDDSDDEESSESADISSDSEEDNSSQD